MVNYRRDYTPGGTYFFTLALRDRQSRLLTTYIDCLGDAFRFAKQKAYYQTIAIVVLHEHLHAIWELPADDTDYSSRWKWIKSHFTQALIRSGIDVTRDKKGECNVWQKRFWEHRIRNDMDHEKHIHYIHNNPVKHGLVSSPTQWPYSSIHRFIAKGVLDKNWGTSGVKETPDLKSRVALIPFPTSMS